MSDREVRFEDFVLHFETSSRGGFRARVLKSPFGESAVGFTLPSQGGPEPGFRSMAGITRDLVHRSTDLSFGDRPPLEIGAELFHSVFQGQVRTLLDKSRGQLELSRNLGLRLKIKIDPSNEDTGALADLPWELLCDDETEDFFALSRQMSLVRYLDVPRSSHPIPFTPPLRILAVGASPRGLEPLDLDEEAQYLEDLNHSSSGIEVLFLSHASVGAVREALSKDTYNVLHFMGHGTFDSASGEGMLAFEGADGYPDLVSGRAFATKLRDLRSLGIVVLNACNTARARHQRGANPFRGVATALVLGGLPAVVAMQRPISDLAAISFSTAFYRHLASGESIDEALTEGRQAIHSARPDDFEWATPVLFLRMPEGNVFVARPADPPEERKPPAPAPVPLPITVPAPEPDPARRGLALKIAAGAAGAAGTVLVAFLLSTREPSSGLQADSGPVTEQGAIVAEPTPHTEEKTGSDLGTDKNLRTASRREPRDRVQQQSSSLPVDPAPTPTPADLQPSEPEEAVPAAADLSSLSAHVVSIARREEGGLLVTVVFKNASGSPLSATLDSESSFLSDDQGRSYSIMDSNLPSSGSNWLLKVGAGASSSHTFNFQAPNLNSKKFRLALSSEDGYRVRVTSPSMTLEGSP